MTAEEIKVSGRLTICRDCNSSLRYARYSYCLKCFAARRRKYWSESYPKMDIYEKMWRGLSVNKRMKKDINMTKYVFLEWARSQKMECEYCGIGNDLATERYRQRLHIDRKNNLFEYRIDNIAFACRICNVSKSNFFSAEEWKEIANKYVRPKWQAK